MYQVIKRNGDVVPFDEQRIKDAILKAFLSQGKPCDPNFCDLLAFRSIAEASNSVKDNKISVESIQDAIEKVLIAADCADVAKAFILYRKQHEKIRNTKAVLNYKKVVDDYLNINDWRVKENSTVTYSVGGLILSNSGAITANYWLSEIYDDEIANAHKNADLHIHDLSMLTGYCFTGDTRVKTLDGENPSFSELVKSGKQEVWVYAFDKQNGKIVPAKAVNPRVTRTVTELVRITLTNEKNIECTPDHPFMLRDGTYLKAEDLKPNMSLMPLYVSGDNSGAKYTRIRNAWANKANAYVHRWVYENIHGCVLGDDDVIHHKDGNKHNNTPDNLVVMKSAEHRALEIRKTMQTENWKEKNREKNILFNKTDRQRRRVSLAALARKRDEGGKFLPNEPLTFAYVPEKDEERACFNHCVRKVTRVKLENPIKVYDLTVPEYHNFAIDAGVFVHNCAGWSLKQLIREGLGGVPGKITSSPAAHLSTLCNQMVNFLGIMQNEWAGKR